MVQVLIAEHSFTARELLVAIYRPPGTFPFESVAKTFGTAELAA
jgi:hypothetical protein